jgi:hypothetical protein
MPRIDLVGGQPVAQAIRFALDQREHFAPVAAKTIASTAS